MNRLSRVLMDAYYATSEQWYERRLRDRRATMRAAETLGAIRSWIGYVGPRKSRIVFLAHMHQAFPESSDYERLGLLRRFWFYHQLRFLDLFAVDRLTPAELRSHVCVEGNAHLEGALAAGRGALVVTAHLGDARMCHVALGLQGYPVHLLSARYDEYARRAREARLRSSRKYHAVHFLDEPLRWIHDALAENKVVFLAISGYGGARGHVTRFLGNDILFSSAPARVALRTRAPVIPALDLVDGAGRHHVFIHPVREGPSSAASSLSFTRRLVSVFEEQARRAPAQLDWIWYVIRCQEQRGEVRAYEEGKAVRAKTLVT